MFAQEWYPRSARGSADCILCVRKPRAEWCASCKRCALELGCWYKKKVGLIIVIDLPKREIRYERDAMRDVSNTKGQEQKFPDTLEFPETGGGFVLLGKAVRTGIKTRYGDRTVVECVERKSKKTFSVWWPKGIPLPSMTLPFMLVRLNKTDFKLVTCDTREEALELWRDGEVKNPAPATDAATDFA